MDLKQLKALLLTKRGAECEWCHAQTLELEVHHWLIHRMAGHPELDCEESCGLVCRTCHQSGVVNSYESRVYFWEKQVARGYDMASWYQELPLKIKDQFFMQRN